MIIDRYVVARHIFGGSGAPIALDGLPTWPAGKLQTVGFTNTLSIQTPAGLMPLNPQTGFAGLAPGPDGFPMTLTCNALGVDPGAPLFDWWVSQRIDAGTDNPLRYLDVTQVAPNTSGSVRISYNVQALQRLLPDLVLVEELLAPDNLKTIFRNVWVHVRRRSDGAIQVAAMYRPYQ